MSTVVSELILIVLTIAVAGLLYAWTIVLTQSVLQKGALGLLPKVTYIGWFLGNYTSGQHYPVIVISFQSFGPTTITGVEVTYGGKVICSYSSFLPSASDIQEGLRVAGFVGLRPRSYDPPISYDVLVCHDEPYPGLLLFQVGKGEPTTITCAQLADWGGVVSADGIKAEAWVTVAPLIIDTLQLGDAVETYALTSGTIIQFEKMTSTLVSPGYVGNVPLPSLHAFKQVRVGRGYWSLVLWCPGINPAIYEQVKVRVFFGIMGVDVEVPI